MLHPSNDFSGFFNATETIREKDVHQWKLANIESYQYLGSCPAVTYRERSQRPENSVNRSPVRYSSAGQSDIKGCQLFSQTEERNDQG